MTTLRATIKGGRLELDVPADWPDGTEVEIHPVDQPANGDTGVLSPEEIASTLAAMEQVVPFDMTEAEYAAWEAERRQSKERDKTGFAEHAEWLGSQWP